MVVEPKIKVFFVFTEGSLYYSIFCLINKRFNFYKLMNTTPCRFEMMNNIDHTFTTRKSKDELFSLLHSWLINLYKN